MKPGRLLFALVLLAGLAGGLWWSNKKEAEKAAAPPADAPPKILALKEDDIQQIAIKRRDGTSTILKRTGTGPWQITAPEPLGADQSRVNDLAHLASSLSADRVVDPNATDLATYGLAPAADELTFTMKDGKASKLLVGDDTPAGTSVYAKLDGDARLFSMSSGNKTELDKSVKDLRDKRLLTFDQDKLSRVELTAKKGSIEFGKSGPNEWQILKPKPLRADGLQVEELIRKMSSATMDTGISGEDAKKGAAAFASAAVLASAKVTDPGGAQSIEVRKVKDDYYAKSSVVAGIFKVTKDLGDGMDKSLEDFLNKKLFDFGFNDPSHVEFKDGAKALAFDKSGDQWTSAGKTMDSTSVQAFIDKLRDVAAAKLADSGFTAPAIELTVTSSAASGGAKKTEKVQISQSAGGKFVARREGEAELYELDATPVQDLRQAAGDVRETAPPPAAAKKK